MALLTACQTPGAVFHTTITPRQIALVIDLPADLTLDAVAAELLEATLHNAVELALAPYFARRP